VASWSRVPRWLPTSLFCAPDSSAVGAWVVHVRRQARASVVMLAVLSGPLLPAAPAHAAQVCYTAPNGATDCYDDGSGGVAPGTGSVGGGGGNYTPPAAPAAPPAVAPAPAPVVVPAPAAPAPAPAPANVQLNIQPVAPAAQAPAPGVVRAPAPANAPAAPAAPAVDQPPAGHVFPDEAAPQQEPPAGAGSEPAATQDLTESAFPTASASGSSLATASESAERIVIKADAASATAEAPTGLVLALSVAGILIVAAAGATYVFVIRPRQIGRKAGGHRA
jgi:hypothetical protein